jgi:hypothetical protein
VRNNECIEGKEQPMKGNKTRKFNDSFMITSTENITV